MSWHDIYIELRSWQSGLGTLFGLGALLLGALWNFRLNRRRDRELRQEETVAVATALYGEILLLRVEVAKIANIVANIYNRMNLRPDSTVKFDKWFLESHPLPEPMIYPALASKLGLLPPGLIISIASFHASYWDAKNSLPLLVEKKGRGYEFSPLVLLRPALNAVSEIESALREIELMAMLTKAPLAPNIDIARALANDEAEMRE